MAKVLNEKYCYTNKEISFSPFKEVLTYIPKKREFLFVIYETELRDIIDNLDKCIRISNDSEINVNFQCDDFEIREDNLFDVCLHTLLVLNGNQKSLFDIPEELCIMLKYNDYVFRFCPSWLNIYIKSSKYILKWCNFLLIIFFYRKTEKFSR